MTEETFPVYQSSKKQLWLSFLGLIMLLLSTVVLFIGDNRYMWIGLIGIIFFGLAEFVIIQQLFIGEKLLILTPDGLYDHSNPFAMQEVVISWDSIQKIELETLMGQALIKLQLDETMVTTKVRTLLQQVNEGLGFGTITISVQHAKYLSTQEIYEKLQEYWVRYR